MHDPPASADVALVATVAEDFARMDLPAHVEHTRTLLTGLPVR